VLNIAEPLLIFVAFLIAWDYRQPEPLLWPGPDMVPVTLEEQRTEEWLAKITPPVLGPNTGTRAKPRNQARRQSENGYTPRHYTRANDD
jgi:hypothetical protein